MHQQQIRQQLAASFEEKWRIPSGRTAAEAASKEVNFLGNVLIDKTKAVPNAGVIALGYQTVLLSIDSVLVTRPERTSRPGTYGFQQDLYVLIGPAQTA
jgi:hypothetical protein